MTDRDSLTYAYGVQQGRIPLSVSLFDKTYAYVLGHDDEQAFPYRHGDYVEIVQEVVLGASPLLTFAANIQQPLMPEERNVSGHYEGITWIPTATLQRANVLGSFVPYVYSQLYSPFDITAGDVLRVAINNGSGSTDYDITLVGGTYTAQQLVDEINTALAGNGVASVMDTGAYSRIKISAAATGRTASIEVKEYPLIDADDHLSFYKKISSSSYPDTAFYGGDDLSMITAPDGAFTAADLDQPLNITGATEPFNNMLTRIAKIIDGTRAILADPVVTEGAGFTAIMPGCLWEFMVYIDTWKALSFLIPRDRELYTDDFKVNVSKFLGTYPVKFRLELVTA